MTSINLRSRVPSHIGDPKAYLAKLDEARAAMTSDHCVAPECVVNVRSGRATQGTPLTAHDLPDGEGPAWYRLAQLVKSGHVLERY
ncbi:MAG: hypothetical protein JWN04_3844 [Myxococcaceae bacterium]|nr:hypothetical protein [Myxococcaceae bacterium]